MLLSLLSGQRQLLQVFLILHQEVVVLLLEHQLLLILLGTVLRELLKVEILKGFLE